MKWTSFLKLHILSKNIFEILSLNMSMADKRVKLPDILILNMFLCVFCRS